MRRMKVFALAAALVFAIGIVGCEKEPVAFVADAHQEGDIITISGVLKEEWWQHPVNDQSRYVHILCLDEAEHFVSMHGEKIVANEIHVFGFEDFASHINENVSIRGTVMSGHTAYHARQVCFPDAVFPASQRAEPEQVWLGSESMSFS
jgi:hypothetical protein